MLSDALEACEEISPNYLQWYAVKTRPHQEKHVRDRLSSVGVEPLLPLSNILRQWSDRKVWKMSPLFSGYCFARFALANRLAVLQTPGVVRIVGALKPEPIPEAELDALMKITASQRQVESCDYFSKGSWVQVIRGPLAGIRGELVRKTDHEGLVIRAHVIQQAAIVHIDRHEVIPVMEPHLASSLA